MPPPTPRSGWYTDPASPSRNRLWDGQRLTSTPRPRRVLPYGAEVSEGPTVDRTSAPRGGRKATQQSAGILMVVILAFALSGVYEVVVGSSGKTAVTGAFNAGPA